MERKLDEAEIVVAPVKPEVIKPEPEPEPEPKVVIQSEVVLQPEQISTNLEIDEEFSFLGL